MITPPSGWIQHFGAHVLTLYPAQGGGRIRCYERLAPLRPLSGVLSTVLEADPDYLLEDIGPSKRLLTHEGEHAAWVPTRGVRGGERVRRSVGVVFADDFVLAIDTLALLRQHFAELDRIGMDLLLSASLGRRLSRRRFLYTPPPGWQALPSGLVATWYPPGFPEERANICVFPANPIEGTPRALFDELLQAETDAGFVVEGKIGAEPFTSSAGLSGQAFWLKGRRGAQGPIFRDLVLFAAGPYRYTLRLESLCPERVSEHRALFRALAASAQPVPLAGQRQPGPSGPEALATLMQIWPD